MVRLSVCSLLLLTGCPSESPSPPTPVDAAGSQNRDSGTVIPPDSGTQKSDSGTAGSRSDVGFDIGTLPPDAGTTPAERMVRFIAIGDTGTGSPTQRAVGQAIGDVCEDRGGCDFGILLGDNIYNTGAESADDDIFRTHFAEPYGHLNFRFFASLGNHDLGGEGLGLDLDFNKATYQIQYSERNEQWIMPAEYYVLDLNQVGIPPAESPLWMVALNTTDIFFSRGDDQARDLPNWLAQAPENTWTVAFGHHPYISNGPHGNAGRYDTGRFPFPLPIVAGEAVKDFFDDHICGRVDLYLAGHDHSRQDLHATCGTEFLVSGAGAKTTDVVDRNPVYYQSDEVGFLLVEATRSELRLFFFDRNGTQNHERLIRR
ncbi:MAG: metallophosphoesterase [Myxococcota bacterium]|nr:metallophosphoesterase [Myxococcota bacterium]